PPSISGLWSANVTGTSMSVHWSTQVQSIQTFQVTLSKTSEASELWETNMTMIELRGLQPGVLYNVTVTPCACGRQGSAVHMMVKTDAQSLDATTRLTNIEFNEDLRNSSSLAFKNLNKTFIEEIYQSLAPELKAMVESGQLRIEIQSFSLGSVVVNFSIIFNQSPGQAMGNLSLALLHALMNSSKFIVDNETTYTASVTLFNTMDRYRAEGGTVEVPRIRLEVPIMCTYMKSMLISTDLGYMG
ncbi:hypothetical protein GOODEAATRI_027749, partial [Goodea atripinnis]